MLVVGEAPQDSNNTATLMYDLTEDVWLIGAPRMFVGNHHASEVIDNKMYLFGGLTTGNHTIQIASLVEGPQGVDVEWSVGADLPVPSGSGITSLIGGMVRLFVPLLCCDGSLWYSLLCFPDDDLDSSYDPNVERHREKTRNENSVNVLSLLFHTGFTL